MAHRLAACRHLVVPGAQRCGTTYLRTLLADHPQVAMAEPARPEPKVFLRARPPDRADYLDRWFAHARPGDLLGEKSTSYLDVPAVPRRIAKTLGDDVRVVVQLRDPIERALSHWAFSTENGMETLPLTEALEADMAGERDWDRSVTSTSPYAYLSRGKYAESLAPWVHEFGERLRVVFLEDLADDPSTIGSTYRWLGLTEHVPGVHARPVNQSSTPTPDLDVDTMAALRDWYREADESLSALLEHSLPWRTTTEGSV